MTRHIGRSRFAALALVALAPACHVTMDEADVFRRGVPTEDTVTATVPGTGTGQAVALTETTIGLRGQTADWYKLTYGVTHVINGGALLVGGLVRAVIRLVPTNLTNDTAVWGPFTGDLEPVTWKLTVTRLAEHQFAWSFDGQPRGNAAAPFVTVLSGTHTSAADTGGALVEGFGTGSFTLDWDARATLPMPKATEMGKAAYTYARLPGAVTTVDAQFRQVLDEPSGKRVDLDYAYTHQTGGGGSMDFVSLSAAQLGMPGGRWSAHSRWRATGAGRTDARASVDTLAGTLTISECWDATFSSTFVARSWEPSAGYGAEATDCAFSPAEYSAR